MGFVVGLTDAHLPFFRLLFSFHSTAHHHLFLVKTDWFDQEGSILQAVHRAAAASVAGGAWDSRRGFLGRRLLPVQPAAVIARLSCLTPSRLNGKDDVQGSRVSGRRRRTPQAGPEPRDAASLGVVLPVQPAAVIARLSCLTPSTSSRIKSTVNNFSLR